MNGGSFGEKLRAWRKQRGLTQEQLAKAAGLNVSYVSNLERDFSANTRSGKPRPSADLCERLARVLHVDIDDALLAAGYAPRTRQLPPTNAAELIEALAKLGISIGGTSLGDLADMTPEQFDNFRRDLEKAVGVTIALHTK